MKNVLLGIFYNPIISYHSLLKWLFLQISCILCLSFGYITKGSLEWLSIFWKSTSIIINTDKDYDMSGPEKSVNAVNYLENDLMKVSGENVTYNFMYVIIFTSRVFLVLIKSIF